MEQKIPKIIHFVWLGDNVPDYAEYSLENHRLMNPDFDIRFLRRTSAQIKTLRELKTDVGLEPVDKVIFRSIRRVERNCPSDGYLRRQLMFYGNKASFIQVLSDIVRIELLNEFGGIYMDCDTFPLKKFPVELLTKDFFIARRDTGGGYFLDNFFMGKSLSQMRVENPYEEPNTFFVNHMPQSYKTTRFLMNRRSFFAKKLKLGECSFTPDYIIDHYCAETYANTIIKENHGTHNWI